MPPASSAAFVSVDPSQFPDAVRRELVRSLRRRQINHKFHYDTYKQANKWLALHEAHSPAHSDPACLDIYKDAYEAVAGMTAGVAGSGGVQVVGLGCGGGAKEERLLRLLRRADGPDLSYAPSDVSLPLVLMAQHRSVGMVPPEHITPLVADLALAKTEELEAWLRKEARRRRIITFFGMVPNFEPGAIVPKLAALARLGDTLLFSANLVPELTPGAMRAILPQYDNELTRDWLMTFLADLGVESRDGDLKFSIEFVRGRVPLARFIAYYHFQRSRTLRLGGDEFAFRRQDKIRLFFSYRYTAETLARTLSRYKLAIRDSWTTPQEGVFLCERVS